ncbi:MAG: phage head-tail adapter protein [Ruminococcus sp.]|nr:phage head-tail adapter protein [Ruminococcus sp.]
MNREWSELNKSVQTLLKKRDTYEEGLKRLFELRGKLWDVICSFRSELSREDFCAIPFIGADGYHSKTIAYSLWHIFRIEDITAHTLIAGDEQVFFRGGYQERTGSPIITTGNELSGRQIADFSEQLDISGLYDYISEVKTDTEKILRSLPFDSLKQKMTAERREQLLSLNVVSSDENAAWLIDYWCGKDVRGLIQMPFSRHWIMHVEACLRIREKLRKMTK